MADRPGGPVREIVLKIHERCNIACDYCYMYESADQGWRARPVMMHEDTVRQVAHRLADHVRRHRLPQVRVVLHGGEPLLAGAEPIRRAVEAFRSAVPAGVEVSFAVQTNGILLSDEFLELFRTYGVRIGVSLDGTAAANDRHRRYASGRSSYAGVVRALERLRRPTNRDIYGGILCTVDIANDPVTTYRSLLEHDPPLIDFLLPHGNWDQPPPGIDVRRPHERATPYAEWLIAVFDRWYSGQDRPVGIRLFNSIIDLLLGGASTTEVIGRGHPVVLTIESDGSIEGSDSLKTTREGLAATGLTVYSHSFDEAVAHPAVSDGGTLSDACMRCRALPVCGGGLRAHRYAAQSGLSRPSVYCADLLRLITHVRRRVVVDLATRGVSAAVVME